MGKHNVRHKRMHQNQQIGIKDNRAGFFCVPVLGLGEWAGFGGHIVGWSCFLPRKGLSVFVTCLNFSKIIKQAKNRNTKSIKTWLLPFLPFLLYLRCFLHLLCVFLFAKVLFHGLLFFCVSFSKG